MSTEESTSLAVQQPKTETLIKEPFTLVRTDNKVELFYRNQSCGVVTDGDTQSLAYVVDVVTDRVHERAIGKVGAAAGLGVLLGAVVGAAGERRKPWYKKIL